MPRANACGAEVPALDVAGCGFVAVTDGTAAGDCLLPPLRETSGDPVEVVHSSTLHGNVRGCGSPVVRACSAACSTARTSQPAGGRA